tara:strand:- start:1243 stop:1557 length:315 start_codon:yes stop_codon:yes gene_type:complete
MLFWIIQQTIISIVLIISVHYIYIFFKNNLTIPKTKDLVNKPAEQYKKIYSSLNENKPDTKEMKNELKNYLKNLSSTKNKVVKQSKPNIQTGENIFSSNNFTNF